MNELDEGHIEELGDEYSKSNSQEDVCSERRSNDDKSQHSDAISLSSYQEDGERYDTEDEMKKGIDQNHVHDHKVEIDPR